MESYEQLRARVFTPTGKIRVSRSRKDAIVRQMWFAIGTFENGFRLLLDYKDPCSSEPFWFHHNVLEAEQCLDQLKWLPEHLRVYL